MPVETPQQLKDRFPAGKKLTANDFVAFIDSTRNAGVKIPAADINGLSEIVNGNYAGEAKTTTIPQGNNFQIWYVLTSGTFSGFLDASAQPLVVAPGDLTSGKRVEFIGEGGVYIKKVTDVVFVIDNALSPTNTTNAVSGKAVGDYVAPVIARSAKNEEVLSFVAEQGKQLINPTNLVVGRLTPETGVINAAITSERTTGYTIPAVSGDMFRSNTNLNLIFCEYDTNGVYLRGSVAAVNVTPYTAGASCAGLKVGIALSLVATTILARGNAAVVYEAYKFVPKDSFLTDYAKKTETLAITTNVSNIKAGLDRDIYETSPNLFDETAISAGKFINASGALVDNAIYAASDYMPLIAGANLMVIGAAAQNVNTAFYDANKVFISAQAQNSFSFPVVAPAGCAFVRITVPTPYIGKYYIQAEVGTARTAYKLFGLYPKVKGVVAFGVGDNVFDFASALNVTVSPTTGALATTASTDYTSREIPAKPSESYYTNTDYNVTFVEYNSSGVYLRGSTGVRNVTPYTTGANCAFIRISVNNGVPAYQFLTVIKGGTSFEKGYYQPYTASVDSPLKQRRVLEVVPGMLQELAVPAKQYFRKGVSELLYFKPMMRRLRPVAHFVRTDFNNYDYSAYATVNSNRASLLTLLNADFLPVQKSAFTIVPGDMVTNNGAIVVNAIGDSITDINTQYQYVSQNCPAVSFVGTCKNATTTLQHEGRSGWTLKQYMELIHSPSTYAGFSPFLHPVAPYRYWGCTKLWIEAYNNVLYSRNMKAKGDEVGGFDPVTGIKLSPATNDVMYNYANARYEVWDGGAWVVITEAALGFTFNYAKYLSTWLIATPTDVLIQLGTNDYGAVSVYTASTVTNPAFIGWYNTIITSIHAVSATIRVSLIVPPYRGSDNNALNAFCTQVNAAMWEQRKMIIQNYDAREAEKIYVIDVGASVDPDNDYPKDGNGIVTDPTHPNSTGFTKMGYRIAAFLQAVR